MGETSKFTSLHRVLFLTLPRLKTGNRSACLVWRPEFKKLYPPVYCILPKTNETAFIHSKSHASDEAQIDVASRVGFGGGSVWIFSI
jgi:hypothetical protein